VSPIVQDKIRFHFESTGVKDAEELASFFPGAIQLLQGHFANPRLRSIVTGFDCDVRIYARPHAKATSNLATVNTAIVEGVYRAEIHLLTTSAIDVRSRTHLGEQKDLAYNQRLLVHEYAAPLLDRITRSKPKGWRFFSAPTWFVQGYEEYLALTCSNEHSKSVTMARYLGTLRAKPGRVRIGEGLQVESPYIGGAMLVRFMYEHFGAEKLYALLLAPEPTFEAAASTHLTHYPDSFFEAWSTWLTSKG